MIPLREGRFAGGDAGSVYGTSVSDSSSAEAGLPIGGQLRLDRAVDVAVEVVGAEQLDGAVGLEHGRTCGFSRASRSVEPALSLSW